MLYAEEYLGEVGVGATAPLFFRANDDHIYIVKVMTNPLGGKVLASEHIAACLGRVLDLPFPASDFLMISDEWLENQPHLNAAITPGIHFASCYLTDTEYITSNAFSSIRNRRQAAGIILFDHLFHNADRDRNRKNILLLPYDTSTYMLYGIDHSHLFRSGRWTNSSLYDWAYRIRLYDQNMYSSFLAEWICADDFVPYTEMVREIEDNTIKDIIRSIPHEWLPDIQERKALFRFIRIRFDLVNDICRKLCRCIPPARGGHAKPYLD